MIPEEIERTHAVVEFLARDGLAVTSFEVSAGAQRVAACVADAASLLVGFDLLTDPTVTVQPTYTYGAARIVHVLGDWTTGQHVDLFAGFTKSADMASIGILPRDRFLLLDLVANESMGDGR